MRTEERRGRDERVLELFLAGATYRSIAAVVGLRSPTSVGNIVARELRSAAGSRGPITATGRAMWIERSERLLAASWPAALAGDATAGEECLRLLRLQARFYGLRSR